MDGQLSVALREGRLTDSRVVDKQWRSERLPKADIEVCVCVC